MKTNPFTNLAHLDVIAGSLHRSIKSLDELMQNAVHLTEQDVQEFKAERDLLADSYKAVCEQRDELKKVEEEEGNSILRSLINTLSNPQFFGHA